MGKIKKSTKKFMKEGLGKAIENRRKVQKAKATREKQKALVKARAERTLARHQAQDLKDEQNNILKYPRTKSRDLESFALVSGGRKKAGRQSTANSNDGTVSSETAHGSDADATNDFGIELDSDQDSDAGASDWDALASDQGSVAEDADDTSTAMAVDGNASPFDSKPKAGGDPVKDELVAHKAVLNRLEADDPEFYAYLKNNDRELLDFDVSASEDSDDDASDDDEVDEDSSVDDDASDTATRRPAGEKPKRPAKPITLTQGMIVQWSETLSKDHDLTVTYQMLQAFESVARAHDPQNKAPLAYEMESDKVFNALITATLRCVPQVFQHYVPVTIPEVTDEDIAAGRVNDREIPMLKHHQNWARIRNQARQFFSSLQLLLAQLHDAQLATFIMRKAVEAVPYFLPFKHQVRRYLMRILYVFQDRTSEESALVTAFLTLRRLTLLAPSQFLEESIRGLYKACIRQAQNVTVFTLPHINLLRQCGVELLGFNTKLSYELAFVYIRQLATQLRNAITAKGRATYKVVYSWQFIQGLKFWTDALCAYHPRKLKQGAHAIDQAINQQIAASLPSLVYPLVQVITGTIGLMPNHLYFPLRFHCVRMLLQISRDTGMYIPTASYVLEVLQSRELNRKPLPSTLKAFPFETHIQCPKSYEHSQVYVDGIMDQVTDITLEFMTQQAANIAFPEIIMPLVAELKRFVKANPKAKIVRPLRHLMEKVRHHCDFIEQERSRVDWAPGDYHMVDTFLSTADIGTTPLPKYYEGHIRVKQQQLKLLKTANHEA